MKRNVLTAPVLKTVRWGLMCLALCLASMPANAADEMANTLVYAGENEDTINPLRRPLGQIPPTPSEPPQCSGNGVPVRNIAAAPRASGTLFAGLVSRKSVPHKNTNAPKTQKFWGWETDFRFWMPQPRLEGFQGPMRERLPVSTGKAGNRDSIKAKVFEQDGGGASPSGSLEGEGKRGRAFFRKFPLPPPISYSFPASSSSQRLSPVRSEPWG